MSNNEKQDVKPSRLKRRLGLAILILIVLWMYVSISKSPLLEIGSIAPSWVLTAADGSGIRLKLADLRGKAVVIAFWSISCPACMLELADLERLRPELENKGVVIVGIAANEETIEDVHSFNKEKGFGFFLSADDGTIAPVYKVSALPTLYIVDQNGKIAAAEAGYSGKKSIEKNILRALTI